MTIECVERADDPRLAAFRDIGDPELLRTRRQFVAEGRLVVARVIEDGRFCVRALLVNEAAREQLQPALHRLPSETPVYVGDPALFLALTGYNIHRGCLALVDRPVGRRAEEVTAPAETILALEGVANADNVGAAFRNAAAFGAGAIVLSPACCDPFYRKAMRTSMAAVLRVPFAVADRWPAELRELRAAGVALVALTPREPAIPLDAFARRHPARLALVAGTEGVGLSSEVEALADYRVRIPISEAVDSLNVAAAIAVALYALRSAAVVGNRVGSRE